MSRFHCVCVLVCLCARACVFFKTDMPRLCSTTTTSSSKMLLACNPWSTFECGICFADAVLGLVAWGLHLCFPWHLGKQRGIQCQHCADAGRISYDRKLGMRQFWRLIIKESHQTKPSIIVNITINPITDGNPFKLTLWYQGVLHGRSPRKKKRWEVRWIKPYIILYSSNMAGWLP